MRRACIVAILLAVGCAESGSRTSTPTPTGEQIGPWQITWWSGAKLQEQEWLRETTREHEALIRTLDPLLSGYRGRIIYYKTRADLDVAYVATQRAHGGVVPFITNRIFLRIGFWHPWDGSFHIWPGERLEGDGLTQMMLRHIYQDFTFVALDPYWQRVMNEDGLLAFRIYQRR